MPFLFYNPYLSFEWYFSWTSLTTSCAAWMIMGTELTQAEALRVNGTEYDPRETI